MDHRIGSNMIGETVSHFKILSKLGEGGMGVIYKAEDTRLQRPVVLKFLPEALCQDRETKERFIHEARTASALDHPNICNIHEIDETENGQVFMSMAFYEGESLKVILERERLPAGRALDIAIQIALGLVKAHEVGIIHRDIKPSNIMITGEGTAKIVDFGIAKIVDESTVTKSGTLLGTVTYMSPEQARGDPIDFRTDIWSLGVVIYEMLTGRTPFTGDYEQAILYSILHENPEPMTDVPAEYKKVVNNCLRKNPDKRYSNSADLLNALISLQEPEHAPQIRDPVLVRRFKQHPMIYRLTGSILLLIVVALFLLPAGEGLRRWLGFRILPSEKYIAVIPFDLMGDSPFDSTSNKGLLHTTTTRLNRLARRSPSMWVVPASEIIKFNIKSASDVRQNFPFVYLVVTGSMQYQGEIVRVTINLIEVKSLRPIGTALIDLPRKSSIAMHDDIVIKILELLKEELPPQMRPILAGGGTTISSALKNYHQGRGLLLERQDLDNIEEAISCFNKSLEQDPDYIDARTGLAEALLYKFRKTKDPKYANQAYEQCNVILYLDNQNAQVHFILGLVNTSRGLYSEALRRFERALELDANNEKTVREMATTCAKMDDTVRAEGLFKEAIRMQETNWANHNALGVFYLRLGRYQQAIPAFEKVVLLTPQNTMGYNNLGSCYLMLNHPEAALRQFERSREIKESYSALSNLGALYFHEEEYESSAAMFKRALRLNDADYVVWGNLASAYYWRKEKRDSSAQYYVEAISRADRALDQNPANKEILINLANYHAMLGHRREAMDYISRVSRMKPDRPEDMAHIGIACEILGLRAQAIDWIKAALESGMSAEKIASYPDLRELRGDERYIELIRQSR